MLKSVWSGFIRLKACQRRIGRSVLGPSKWALMEDRGVSVGVLFFKGVEKDKGEFEGPAVLRLKLNTTAMECGSPSCLHRRDSSRLKKKTRDSRRMSANIIQHQSLQVHLWLFFQMRGCCLKCPYDKAHF